MIFEYATILMHIKRFIFGKVKHDDQIPVHEKINLNKFYIGHFCVPLTSDVLSCFFVRTSNHKEGSCMIFLYAKVYEDINQLNLSSLFHRKNSKMALHYYVPQQYVFSKQ